MSVSREALDARPCGARRLILCAPNKNDSSHADAVARCDERYYAVPCPPELMVSGNGGGGGLFGCPGGQYCYGR